MTGGVDNSSADLPAEASPEAQRPAPSLRQETDVLTQRASRIRELERQLRVMGRENRRLHRRVYTVEQTLDGLYRSSSWRITWPLRRAGRVWQIMTAWVLFKPDTRTRRTLDAVLNAMSSERRARFEAEAALRALRAEPKFQLRYILVDDPSGAEPAMAGHAIRELCGAYLQSEHEFRLVRWDADLQACVLVDKKTFASFGGSFEDQSFYPDRKDGARVAKSQPGSRSWLLAPGGLPVGEAATALVAWARTEGLPVGAVVHEDSQGAGLAPETIEVLKTVDRLWPVSDRLHAQLAEAGAAAEALYLTPLPRRALQGEGWDSSWSDLLARIEATGPGASPLIYYWVDTTVAVPVNTGIQRVVRQMARELLEAGFKLVPVKWGGSLDQPLAPVSYDELMHFARWNGPDVNLWHGWSTPAAHSGGGWFIMNELPHNLAACDLEAFRSAAESAGLKTAAVFYDTIPWKMAHLYPETFSAAHLHYMSELARYSRVLAISEYSRAELVRTLEHEFGLDPSTLGHVLACPLAAEFPESTEPAPAPPCRADGAIEILCLGTVEPRKNHERLLEAFDLACKTSAAPLHLTIVGGGHSFEPDLAVRVRAKVNASSNIDWEESADDARVKQLYARCHFTIYPSVEEGFGLPILESLWYGKPAICANFGAMGEVAEGGGCVMVDVTDVGAMAKAICDLANAPDRLARLKDEAKVRTFRTWRDYGQNVASALGLGDR